MEEALLCFESVSRAILAEQELTGAGFPVRVMPVPAAIRAGCGFCLRLSPEHVRQAAALLAEQGCPAQGLYTRAEAGGAVSYRSLPLP